VCNNNNQNVVMCVLSSKQCVLLLNVMACGCVNSNNNVIYVLMAIFGQWPQI